MRIKPWISVLARQQHLFPAPAAVASSIYAQTVNRTKSPGDIEETASLPVLRFDNPNIGVEVELAGEFLFCFGRIDPGTVMEPREQTVVAILHFALRRRSEQSGETVEPVDLDENRAGFRSTPAAQHGKRAFLRATPEIGRYPKIGT
jgi:hypothetical protein